MILEILLESDWHLVGPIKVEVNQQTTKQNQMKIDAQLQITYELEFFLDKILVYFLAPLENSAQIYLDGWRKLV